MRYYRVREWKIRGPKPKPVKAKKGEEAPPPPPPIILTRFRKVERSMTTTGAVTEDRDLCDHDHVTRADADKCPVAASAMEKAGYVGEEDQASLDHAKRQEAHEAKVAAAQAKEAAAAE